MTRTSEEEHSLLVSHRIKDGEHVHSDEEAYRLLTRFEYEDHDDVKHLHRDPSSRRILICVTVSLLLTFLNLLISYIAPAAVNSTHDRYTSRAQRLKDADLLYRPDMYIGLDRVDADVERLALPESLHVLPHVFAPVNRSDPGKIFPSDGRSRTTFNGVVSPGEPHVIINKDVSMIMQHRVQGRYLGRCSVASAIPDPDVLRNQNRTLTLAREITNIEIWALDSSAGELDLTTLSWNTRPRRTTLLSNLVVQQNTRRHSAEFECGPPRSLILIELACPDGSGSECNIEFWQEQPETVPRLAINMVQKPSI